MDYQEFLQSAINSAKVQLRHQLYILYGLKKEIKFVNAKLKDDLSDEYRIEYQRALEIFETELEQVEHQIAFQNDIVNKYVSTGTSTTSQ